MKLRIWKSLTFFIGLILFIGAFGVILLSGSIFNPPPYRIVIALQTVDPYTELTREMVAVDEQTMNQRVASRLVHEGEIERYLGGMVVETIHAGEPVRRSAVTSSDNPAAVHRLSLALTDPHLVAAVVPVTPKIIPDNVTAGDYVNVTMGLEGSIAQLTGAGWRDGIDPDAWGGMSTPVPLLESESPMTPTRRLPLAEETSDVTPPLDKIVLPHVEVIQVTREKMPNPNYGMGFGGNDASTELAFLEGDIQSVTLLVPTAAEELLYFAVDNGALHLSVVPHAAVVAGAPPSTGVLWEDVVRFFQEERLRALETTTAPVTVTYPLSATEVITGGKVVSDSMTPVPLTTATPRPASTVAAGTDESSSEQQQPESGSLFSQFSDWAIPVCAGGGLLAGLGIVGFILMRRRRA